MENKSSYHYIYSIPKQNDIRELLKKYGIEAEHPNIASLEKLRALDRSVETPGKIAGLTVGILGILTLGTGMSMTMVWYDTLFVPGILIGILGLALVISAYPLCMAITRKERKKKTNEIREICEE